MTNPVPDMSHMAMFELKPKGNGTYVLEAYGFESMPFDLEDLRSNEEWFSRAINSVALGTVQ